MPKFNKENCEFTAEIKKSLENPGGGYLADFNSVSRVPVVEIIRIFAIFNEISDFEEFLAEICFILLYDYQKNNEKILIRIKFDNFVVHI